jgi:hypothetical protein
MTLENKKIWLLSKKEKKINKKFYNIKISDALRNEK